MSSMSRGVRGAIIALVTLIVLAGVTVVVVNSTDDEQAAAPARTVTVAINGNPAAVPLVTQVDTNATKPGRQEAPVVAPAAAVVQAAAGELGDHAGERNETPPGVSPGVLEAGREAQDRLAANDQLPAVTPDAAPSQRGCITNLVRNYSTRRGVAPRLWVIHYTVSPNRAGIGDVNAVVNLFNTPSFAASSNYVLDREGNCKYIVRESDKAWTQAAANPFAISVEIINSGREGSLINGPGLRKLGVIISDSARRWHIPLRLGAVKGCAPSRSGIVSHQMLGACGGGHVDVSPYPLQPIIAAAIAARGGCSAACVRARDLRRRNLATHHELRARRCAAPAVTRSERCRFLHRRHAAIHKAAKEAGARL